ncbi:hypothetical protein [Roseicitreum antarcticum]|uniref:Membrane protein involved in the export of O-antigen and teichoic acid n=1 Tax=Roseicitreum antarcticum TaxID=564137 RepID=A0A1H3CNU3_9RHOB|nr:hypothetical protein [Roseicitreum antarcticum]SDX55823.1 hypothetical protein SAMN04488238_1104 [Roseicitreum antarcticum]
MQNEIRHDLSAGSYNPLVRILRTTKLARLLASNSVATWASFVAKAMPLFLLPPFIFSSFTAEQAAIWFILITLQGMQLLIAASTGQPMVRGFAYALGGATQVRDMRKVAPQADSEPNMDLLSRVWSASAFAHVLIGVLTLALLTAMGIWSGMPLISELPGQTELWGAMAVFIAGGALRAYGGQHVSYLTGVNRIALLRWWETAFWVTAFAMALGAVLAGGDMLALALAYQIPLLANLGWNAWLCRRDQAACPGFRRVFRPDFDILAQMWPAIWKTGLGTFLYLGATQGAGLYYATFGAAVDVAAFLFAMSLIRPLGQFAQVPFVTKLPMLARMQASGERGAQQKIVQRSMMLTYILHVVLLLLVAATLPIATGLREDEIQVPILLWLLIGLAGYVERIGAQHLQLYATTNHVLIHWANGLAAAAYLAFAAIALPILGVYAFPIAQFFALIIVYVPIGAVNSYRAFELRFPAFELKTSAVPLVIVLLVVLWIWSRG